MKRLRVRDLLRHEDAASEERKAAREQHIAELDSFPVQRRSAEICDEDILRDPLMHAPMKNRLFWWRRGR